MSFTAAVHGSSDSLGNQDQGVSKEWLVAHRVEQGFSHGSAFCNHDGKDIGSGIYEGLILEEMLLEHQEWEALQGSEFHKRLEGIWTLTSVTRSFGRSCEVPSPWCKRPEWETLMSTEWVNDGG